MIRPKNFRQLRRSIITQKEESQDTSTSFIHQSPTQQNIVKSFKKISATSIPSESHYQENSTPNYTSPIRCPLLKKNITNKSPNNNQINSQYDILHKTPKNQKKIDANTSQKKKLRDGTRNNFLQFQGQAKKKLNFQHLPQQFVKERLSSKKKQSLLLLGPISFKNIIENSPQCRETQRELKMPNKEININNYAQTERQAQRKSSLNKLKNQFATIKKNMENNIKQMNSEPLFTEIVLQKNRYEKTHGQVICFSKKIIKKGSNSTIFKQNAQNCQKNAFIQNKIVQKKNYNIQFYNPFLQNKEIYESITDIVNISRDSQLDSQCSDLDMSPCF